MTTPVKVLTCYYMHKPGGFCKRLRMAIEACLNRGWRVHYLSVEPFPYTHPNLVPHILPTPMKAREGFAFWIYFFSAAPLLLLWLGLRQRVTLALAVSPVYAWLLSPLACARRLPMLTLLLSQPVFHTGTRPSFLSLGFLERWMERSGLAASTMLIANSEGSHAQWLSEYGQELERIAVIPNNVETAPFDKRERRRAVLAECSFPDDAFLIATAAILEEHKNIACLLDAFAQVPGPRARLVIMGEGAERPALEARARRLNIKERVHFTGWRTDSGALLEGMDVFVLPSFREGMSESLLEAATSDLVCLVSALPENMEVITASEQHFDPNRPEELAEKIQRLLDDAAHYAKARVATEKDGARFVFDWQERFIQAAAKLVPSAH